ncbi:PIG-L family deacetylase [Streptomyces sp. NPDC059918]|uniref:PIG-L family deacetylase n=1 Tax=unclassified Streptomyces TaxID=2593676 RepID=UPI003664B3F0
MRGRELAEARQNGIRAAYAQMATGDRTSPWRRTSVPTAGGGRAEIDVLTAKPSVQLVWLQMREAESVGGNAPVSLHGLWDGKTARIPSLLTSGTPVRQPFTYDKAQVVATIEGVLEHYRPTLVRTQDPTPGEGRTLDHQDHVYGARFVQAALAGYAAHVPYGQRPHFTVHSYLGYQTSDFASVLDPAEALTKVGSLKTYAWVDRRDDCGSPAGCGDLHVASRPTGNHWTDDIRDARGDGTSWTATGADGGTWAFAVLDGQMAVWQGIGSGSAADGPHLLPGTGLDPGAEGITLPDGRIAVLATRTVLGSTAAGYHRELVYAQQQAPGSTQFTPWRSLGAPDAGSPDAIFAFSAPAVTVDRTGALDVYVRAGDHTLRDRTLGADGAWTPWQRLGGRGLAGDPVAATAADGTRYVFAPTATSVTAWVGHGPAGPLGAATATGLPATTLPLTAAPDGDGVRLWFREPGTGDVLTTGVTTTAKGISPSPPADLGGTGGYGPVSGFGGTVAGGSGTGHLAATPGPGGAWTRIPVPFTGGPAAFRTVSGPSVAVIGRDARLHVTGPAHTTR